MDLVLLFVCLSFHLNCILVVVCACIKQMSSPGSNDTAFFLRCISFYKVPK